MTAWPKRPVKKPRWDIAFARLVKLASFPIRSLREQWERHPSPRALQFRTITSCSRRTLPGPSIQISFGFCRKTVQAKSTASEGVGNVVGHSRRFLSPAGTHLTTYGIGFPSGSRIQRRYRHCGQEHGVRPNRSHAESRRSAPATGRAGSCYYYNNRSLVTRKQATRNPEMMASFLRTIRRFLDNPRS
jgi:hypothetical protein